MKVIAMKTLHRLLKMKTMVFKHYHVVRRSELSKKIGRFDVIECLNWVNVVAINSEGKMVMVRQYRQGTDEITLEIPGGAIDPGEDKLVAAKRELQEETGYTSDQWHFIGEVTPNPAFMSNYCATYLALDCKKTHELKLDPFEEIEVEEHPVNDVEGMVANGEIHHALVVAGIHYYQIFKSKLK
jgi:ADP-ribose pyrophosphatase